MSSMLAALVRRHDPDRFFATLFAPEPHRETLLLLYAFNHELARAREAAHQPHLALIRLHWWREVVEGAARAHEVATPLSAALDAGRLPRAALLALIDAREDELDPAFPDTDALWAALLRGPGALAVLAGEVLGAEAAPRLAVLGAAYGMAGLLRSIPAHAGQERCFLPANLLGAQALRPDEVIAAPAAPRLAPVRAALARTARDALGPPSPLPAPALAAGLPAAFARRDLARPDAAPRPHGVLDRAAVVAAALSGRV